MWIVYRITNVLNFKLYYGLSSQTLDDRWYDHCAAARNRSPYYFHRALRKYGVNAWLKEVVQTCATLEEANNLEHRLIIESDSCHSKKGYNRTKGGDGCAASEATRRKMSLAAQRPKTPKHKAAMSAYQLSLAERGACNLQRPEVQAKRLESRLGVSHSDETKALMRAAAIARGNLAEETRLKMSQAHKGVPLSEEHRKALSEGQKGRIVSEETREKLRVKHLGKKMSEEARKKMSEKAKQRWAKKRGEV